MKFCRDMTGIYNIPHHIRIIPDNFFFPDKFSAKKNLLSCVVLFPLIFDILFSTVLSFILYPTFFSHDQLMTLSFLMAEANPPPAIERVIAAKALQTTLAKAEQVCTELMIINLSSGTLKSKKLD